MKTLLLETSTEKSCIALCTHQGTLTTLFLPGGPTLSKNLALEVSLLLKQHAFRPTQIAVGQGPGSFTGTRVGLALAKALAFGWNIPLICFCSLELFAPSSPPPFAVLVDAKMGGVYVWRPGETARLLPIAEATCVLESVPLLASPHPELLKKRLLPSHTWIETFPDPLLNLSQDSGSVDFLVLLSRFSIQMAGVRGNCKTRFEAQIR